MYYAYGRSTIKKGGLRTSVQDSTIKAWSLVGIGRVAKASLPHNEGVIFLLLPGDHAADSCMVHAPARAAGVGIAAAGVSGLRVVGHASASEDMSKIHVRMARRLYA